MHALMIGYNYSYNYGLIGFQQLDEKCVHPCMCVFVYVLQL